MTLRRLCFAASLMASIAAIVAELSEREHPLLWLAVAVGFIGLAGTVDE